MYLKNGLTAFLKVKNVIFLILGVFLVSTGAAIITQLIVGYSGDLFTVLHARAFPESIILILVGIVLIVSSRISRRLINDAVFFSGYFEGDLNGYVDFAELAEVTGKTTDQIRRRVGLVRPLYMKNYRIIRTVNYRYPEIIELYSKTITCSCRSCGGLIEKRVFFEGRCPYCGSSDLTAQVVSGQRLYCINDNAARKPDDPAYYEGSPLQSKRIGYAVGFGIELFFFLIFLIVFLTMVNNYNNEPYFRDMFGSGVTSYSLFRSDLLNAIILFAFALAAIVLTVPITFTRMLTIESAQRYARDFARFPKPFLTLQELDLIQKAKDPDSTVTPEDQYKRIVKAVKEGYLRGCSPEKHGGVLRIALAKQIVKDRCPGCGAPIVGAVTGNYQCGFCGRQITGVIRKQ
ncbi:MAG: hypothetical protein IJG87_10290 [Ruminococcus sp.]|nr:hypothetical protein [Ruminococcus sp.]